MIQDQHHHDGGPWANMRMLNMNAICTLVMSVVSLVTRLDVEKWSMFPNEKILYFVKDIVAQVLGITGSRHRRHLSGLRAEGQGHHGHEDEEQPRLDDVNSYRPA